MTSGLWNSTPWSGLACRCLHTEELSDVRCSSIRFIKLHCVCPMYEAPHEQVNLYTTLNRFSKACRSARSLQFYLQCTDDDNRSCRNVCNMSFVSFSLGVIFIIKSKYFSNAWRYSSLYVISCIRHSVAQQLDKIHIFYESKCCRPTSGVRVLKQSCYSASI